jgi:hypothetical protein
LQVRGHLPGQHLNEARPVHTDGLPVVGGIFQGNELSGFIHGAARGNAVAVIERQTIEALRQDENFRHSVTAST